MSDFIELKDIAGTRRFVNINNINQIVDIEQDYSCLVYFSKDDCFTTIKSYDEVVAIIKQEYGYSQQLHLARCKIEELKSLCTSEDKLIKELRAEIERYEKESNKQFDKMKLLDDRTKQRYAELFEEAKEFVRTEAIKEFAERLKAKVDLDWDNSVDVEDIDRLVAEMVGGENA